MEISELHIIVTHIVHGLSGEFITQKRRITLDKSIQVLLFIQVVGNALDLIGRTSVKRGYRGGITDIGRDRLNILSGHVFKSVQMTQEPLAALLEYFRILRFLHAFDKSIDLLFFNSRQVVTHGDIKLEAVG